MTTDALNSLFAEVRADYRRALPEKFAELDALCKPLTAGNLVIVQRELHTLVGTAKTLGLPAVTDAARSAELFLEPYFSRNAVPPAAEQLKFGQLLDVLIRSADK